MRKTALRMRTVRHKLAMVLAQVQEELGVAHLQEHEQEKVAWLCFRG